MTTYATNPPRSGDLIDFSNQSAMRLTVAGTPINFSSTSYWKMGQIQVSYEGKTLEFSEIATPTVAYPTFDNEDLVELQFDFGSGLTTYFKGRVKTRRHGGVNNNEEIVYTARGFQNIANECIVKDDLGIPLVTHFGGTNVATVVTTTGSMGIKTFFGTTVAGALTNVFNLCSTELSSMGIPTTIGSPGVGVFSGFLNQDHSLQNTGFVDALKQIAAHEPDRKVFFDDTQQAWIFPSVTDAPLVTVDISTVNMPTHQYSMDTTNRYTAYRMLVPVSGRRLVTSKGTAALTELWDQSLEINWCLQWATVDLPADWPTGHTWVYRRWAIPVAESEINPNAPVRVYAKYNNWGQDKYVAVDAQIDMHEGIVVTNVPIVVHGNPYIPGEAIGPDAMYLTWFRKDSLPVGGIAEVRYPESGYEGTAYTMFGIEREKQELVDNIELSSDIAQSRLKLLKDVIVAGNLKLEGDPAPELINLQKRVVFTHQSKTTGLETISAMFLAYTYRFGKRGESTVSLTTDMKGLIRVN